VQILVVAGEGVFAERLQRLIEGSGHACELLRALRPAIDRLGAGDVEVVVLTEDLSADSAFLLAATVQGKHRATRVVAVVPEDDAGRGPRLEAVGVGQLLQAPLNPLTILEAAETTAAVDPNFTGYEVVDPSEIAALEALRTHDGGCRETMWLLGFAYYRARRFHDAISTLESLTVVDPRHFQAHYYLGSSYYRTDDASRALSAWKRVLETDPTGRLSTKAQQRIDQVQAGR
jgi:tetratricopeptide (TPR) repeat protein